MALQELRWGSERAEEYRTTKENQQHYKLDKPNFQLSIQLGLHRVYNCVYAAPFLMNQLPHISGVLLLIPGHFVLVHL